MTASKIVAKRAGMDSYTLQAALEGTVGAAFAANIMSMIRFGEQLPSYERVCEEPDDAPLPTNPTAQIVQVYQFITQVADRLEAEAVSIYVKRMKEEMKSLYVNTVANSPRLDVFSLSKTFGVLLAENRKFLGQ